MIVVEKQKDEEVVAGLFEQRQNMIAVGAVIAAHQIEQAAFRMAEAVHGSSAVAETEEPVRQVARPGFGKAELTERFQPAFAMRKGLRARRL